MKAQPIEEKLMNAAQPNLLTGVFDDPRSAERGFQALLDAGYDHNEIHVLMSEKTREKFREIDSNLPIEGDSEAPHATSKVLAGAGAVSAAGAAGGVLMAAGLSVVIPGAGLLVIGPLAALGAGVGAALGAMYGIPFSEMAKDEKLKDRPDYASMVREGKILISVETRNDGDRERIQREWDRINSDSGKGL